MSLPVLFQDEDLVVVNKPAGLLVHRTLLDKSGTEFALQMVRDLVGAAVYPVHRLDRPTSGALVFAKSSAVARTLSESWFSARKEYLAVCRGILKTPVLRLDYPLREELDAKADALARKDKGPQAAVTDFELLDSVELPFQVDRYPASRYALVRARPLTGRKHQIRRHLRHLGHPIVGDVNHGVGKHNRFFAEKFGVRRLLLACTEISFVHPVRGGSVSVRAPLSLEFREVLTRLWWGAHLE